MDDFVMDEFVYIRSNNWSNIPKSRRDHGGIRKTSIPGIEVRVLPKGHLLENQKGVFAKKKFSTFDIIGEYTGNITFQNGRYVAAIDKDNNNNNLGIDAETHGNEMRFINHYRNIGMFANVVMRVCYIDTYPHIIIVCTRDILEGEEVLLDYGDAYIEAYNL